jgi:transposase
VAEERARHPGAAVELWAFDEHRAGLKPVVRRVWAKRGRRPVAVAEPRYQWLYVYGFVRPTSGAVEWFLCNAVNAALFAAVLARFAAAVGAGPDKRVILVLDGAGWHASAGLAVPEGVRLEFLPPYSPELQPAERLWPLANEAVANRHFADVAELDAALAERCLALRDQPEVIRASTRFHWWPEAA